MREDNVWKLYAEKKERELELFREEIEVRDKEIEYLEDKLENKSNTNKSSKHKKICEELYNLYIKKNIDYGDSFGETYKELGIISAVTRLTDKTNRIKRLSLNKAVVRDESIIDTLMDLSNYAIMTIMEIELEGDE